MNPFNVFLLTILSMCLVITNGFDYKTGRPTLEKFLNYGIKRNKLGLNLENEIIKSKVTVLGDILKRHVHKLRQAPGQNVELVFLVDSSASVGAENFFNEIKFVRKLLADFTVAYNHTRVAVITFSSRSKVIRQIDHVAHASETNHKCSLLAKELPKIRYSGGGTYTLGALLEAQGVLAIARNDAVKAVFLVTDGYSNGGDPRPAAEFLKSRGVIIFTFGIQNGNVKELYDMASDPKEEHSYILDSFQEFEALARRALHEDLQSDLILSQNDYECNSLCKEGFNCCDKFADCTCGAHTGVSACTCRRGYYGTGLKGDCKRCPAGTYRDFEGTGDVTTCQACPDPYMTSEEGSTSPFQCYCRTGYTQSGLSCQKLQCPILEPPKNGFFVRGVCENVVNAACGISCSPGYKLKGSSIRLCGKDGKWSGSRAKCVMKSCPKMKPPKNGTMSCSSKDSSIDAECNFRCDPGFQLVGSRTRTCLPVAMWDGIRVYCKAIYCPSHPVIKNGFLKPASCTVGKTKYGSVCEFGCNSGYVLRGPEKTACIGKGTWSGDHKSRCIDVDPPIIQCPSNMTVRTAINENYANVEWEPPIAKDRSKGKVLLTTVPATIQPMKMKIGLNKITYYAKDESGNRANCSFFVNVLDKEPPIVDWCESPPTFLSQEDEVDVFWEEPIFSDNSGYVEITRSKEPGKFKQGETQVIYTAVDRNNNIAYCNLTIKIQKHACDYPLDPINGSKNCTENPEAVYCTLTCEDGYAFAMRPDQDYFCAYDGIWMPSDNPMPFPECSVTTISNSVTQSGELALNDEGTSVCNDIFFMSQIENKLEQKLEEALETMCGDDILCNVAAVEAVCESILSEMEESENSLFFRKRRSLTDEKNQNYIKEFWPSDKSTGFKYWRRGTPHNFEKYLLEETTLPKTRVKRQFGFPKGLFKKDEKKNNSDEKKEKANFLGVLTSVILESLGNDIGMTHFSSFLNTLGTDKQTYELEDFMIAFSKKFGDEKAQSLRTIAEQKLGRFIKSASENGTNEIESTEKTAKYSQDTQGFQSDGQKSPVGSELLTAKKNLKVKFKIEGRGDEPSEKMSKAMLSLMEFADQGHFDIDFGEKQLKVAALRLSEDPEYLCDAGNVLQGKLCVKCPVGTFFNVIAKECQSCPSGSFQPEEGQVSCLVCPDNTFTKSRNAKSNADCKAMCLPGSFSADTLEPCATCEIGKYQDEYATEQCKICPENTTTWRRGAWVIEECQAPCPAGFVSENGLVPCLPCPVGTFQLKEGQTTCFVCPQNSATSSNGTTSIAECIDVPKSEMVALSQLKVMEINDCFSFPCFNDGTCSTLKLGYKCDCKAGYAGQNCEVETNECDSDPCMNSGQCVDKVDAYECLCSSGFTGFQCEENINECISSPCVNNATCVDLIDSFKCLCDSGYSGLTCEKNIDECDPDPCENDGTCVDGISDYTCECSKGFTGRDCQIQIDMCKSSPCVNGKCVSLVGDFSCDCDPGYSGVVCDYNINDCEDNPCENGGTCEDWINGFSCKCLPGFSGKKCDVEMPTDFIMEISSSGVMDYARLDGLHRPLNETTLCFWMKTDDTNNYGTPVSYATDEHDNSLTITDYNGFVLYVNGENVITDISANDGIWHFICATWENFKGSWVIYKDGEKQESGDGLSQGKIISDNGVLVIGQEQDQKGGTFSAPESFVGEIGMLNLWDKVFSAKKIRQLYSECERYVGNIRAWPDFEIGLMGKIKIKHSPFCRGCGVLTTPSNGILINQGSHTGDVVKVKCDTGYKLYRGDSTRKCLIQGYWSGSEPECRAVSCGYPRLLYNGESKATSYDYGGLVTYSCKKGYRLKGASTRTCDADGKWTGEEPTCEIIKCSSPNKINNAVMHSSLESYFPTNKIIYSCMKGYQMDGPSFKTCNKNGKWGQGGSCQPVTCQKAPNIVYGKLADEVKMPVSGSKVKVICDEGFVLKGESAISCDENGEWIKPFSKCVLPSCTKPPKIENGIVKVRASLTQRQAVYKCDEGYVLEGKKKITCKTDGTWDAPFSKCISKYCPPPTLPENGIKSEKRSWRIGEQYVLKCKEGFSPKSEQVLTCKDGYDNGEWIGDEISCEPVFCESVNKIAGGIFRIIEKTEPLQKSIVFPPVLKVGLSRRRRSNSFHPIGSSDQGWSEFPSLSLSDNKFSSTGFSTKPLTYSSQSSYHTNEFPPIFTASGQSSTSSFNGYEQSPHNIEQIHGSSIGGNDFTNFGQTSGSKVFDRQGVSFPQLGFNEFSQNSQSSKEFHEFGQTSQNSGFDFDRQTSQNSGFDFDGQTSQSSGFDFDGQTSQNSGFDFDGQTSQNSGFDYDGQTSQTSGFDYDGQTSQASGFDYDGQISQTSGFDYDGQISQTSGFDYDGQTSQTSGFDYDEPDAQYVGKGKPQGAGYLNMQQPYNTTIEYECRPGYKLIGSEYRHCTEKGWDAPEPRCYELYCPEIQAIEHGAIMYYGSGVNSKVDFNCNEGFQLEGDVERVCQYSRQWTGESPACIKIDCGTPKDLPNGKVEYNSTTFNSVAVYHCAEGFVLEGSLERFCDASGYWNGSRPRCEQVSCDVPPVIKHGYITFEGSLYTGSPVEYACEDCYELVGPEIRTCQVNGVWSLTEPKCELIRCSTLPNEIDNGILKVKDMLCGSTAKVKCNPGFEIKGKKQATCTERGQWREWRKKLPSCEKITCEKPKSVENGTFIGNSFEFEDILSYKCNKGFVFQGEENVTCQEDGLWSKLDGFCKLVECKKPQGPSNGKLRLNGLFYKSSAKIVCDPGFKLEGVDRLECQSDGNWNQPLPFCLPIICPAAETPEHSFYNSTDKYFESFTVLEYGCEKGYYKIYGDITMKCSAEGNWTGNLIECAPVDCGNPGDPLHGRMIQDSSKDPYIYQKNVTFVCDEGYDLVGHHIVTCLDNGDWSDKTSCERITCDKLDEIENGQATYEGSHGDYGSTIHFKCNKGYILKGSAQTICLQGAKWSSGIPKCVPVTCPQPQEAFGAIITGQVYEYGQTISYECKKGYNLKGKSSLTCMEDGNWSSQYPVCDLILCMPPDVIAHGKYKSRNVTLSPIKTQPIKGLFTQAAQKTSRKSSKVVELLEDQSEQLMFKLGAQIEVICDEGYRVSTNSMSSCTENGWEPLLPTCTIVSCPEPAPINHGKVLGTEFSYGSSLNYSCDTGYELTGSATRICAPYGKWSKEPPLCKPIQCPTPSSLANGEILGNRYQYQSTISYSCDEGFELQGPEKRSCQSNRQWTNNAPVCVEIFCPIPSKIPHSIIDMNNLKVGSKVTYECLEGYKLMGNPTLVCTAQGTWNENPPKCKQITCGSIRLKNRVTVSNNGSIYNTKVTFGCMRGYKLNGPSNSICLQNGAWSNKSPVCERIICLVPKIPAHGVLKSSTFAEVETSSFTKSTKSKNKKKGKPLKMVEKVYGVDDTIEFGCDPGWKVDGEITLKCTENGIWSNKPPVCKRILCPKPPALTHVKYQGTDHLYGSTINITCQPGFKLVGANALQCNEKGKWSGGVYKCEPVDCGLPAQPIKTLLTYRPSKHGKFKLGSEITYSCIEGYELHGTQKIKCTVSGVWSHSNQIPVCKEKKCGVPFIVGNSTYIENQTPQTATYICNRGYYLVGENITTCSLGKWKDINITCEPVDCYKPQVPKWGKITAKHFTFGSVANYTCVEGYEIKGNPTVICGADAHWLGALPSCQLVDCGIPEKQANGKLIYKDTKYSSIAQYSCNEGFELKGNKTRSCAGDGNWSGHIPQCHRVQCPEPNPPKHGFAVGASYLFGDQVRFTCSPGYIIVGSESIQCTQEGNWSDDIPTCTEVECGPPPFLVNGLLPVTKNGSYIYKDEIEYGCEKGFIARGDLTSMCNRKGVWTEVKGRCSRIACGKPQVNTNGAIVIGRSYLYKDRVKVSCPPGTHSNGTNILTCQHDGSWSKDATCITGCSRKCLNGGVCVHRNKCSCLPGYTGPNCQRAMCPQKCLNGGKCVAPYKCKCLEMYTGTRCQTPLCPLPCLNNGICTGVHRCTCLTGYTGTRCQRPICRYGCGKSGRCIGPDVCLCKYGDIAETCKEYSEYDHQQESTIFSDWDIAALRANRFKRP